MLQSRSTLLLEAAKEGDLDRVQSYADVDTINAQDHHGRTALMLTCLYGHTQAAQVLLQRKAAPDLTNFDGHTPLMKAATNGHVEVTKLLIRAGANIEKRPPSGFTSLMWAASDGHTQVCQVLIEARADLEAVSDGWTSLMFAASNNHTGAIRLLLDNGANPDVRNKDNQTAFDIGKQKGLTRVIELLSREMQEIPASKSQRRASV